MPQIKLTNTEQLNVDAITSVVMDKIRDVLIKYEEHYPDWNNDDFEYNLDDRIYYSIHYEIQYEHERRKADKVSPNQ